jgi:hypothetical protein
MSEHKTLPLYGARLANSLRAILPFAENEVDGLYNAERRDKEDLGASTASAALDLARGALSAFEQVQVAMDRLQRYPGMSPEEAARHYLETHGTNILQAMQTAREHAKHSDIEHNDASYWDHELKALDEAVAVVEPQTPEQRLIKILMDPANIFVRTESASTAKDIDYLDNTIVNLLALADDVEQIEKFKHHLEAGKFRHRLSFIYALLEDSKEMVVYRLGYGATLKEALTMYEDTPPVRTSKTSTRPTQEPDA